MLFVPWYKPIKVVGKSPLSPVGLVSSTASPSCWMLLCVCPPCISTTSACHVHPPCVPGPLCAHQCGPILFSHWATGKQYIRALICRWSSKSKVQKENNSHPLPKWASLGVKFSGRGTMVLKNAKFNINAQEYLSGPKVGRFSNCNCGRMRPACRSLHA